MMDGQGEILEPRTPTVQISEWSILRLDGDAFRVYAFLRHQRDTDGAVPSTAQISAALKIGHLEVAKAIRQLRARGAICARTPTIDAGLVIHHQAPCACNNDKQ